MKKNTQKSILQKITISILSIMLLFNFILPTIIYAEEDQNETLKEVGGVLFKPIQYLVLGLGDTAMWIVNTCAYGEEVDPILSLSTSTKPWYYKLQVVSQLVYDSTAVIGNPFAAAHIGAEVVTGNVYGYKDGKKLLEDLFPEDIDIPILLVSPERIFSNEVPILDVNIIKPNTYKNSEGEIIETPVMQLQNAIASWYIALRNLALVGLLSILVYVGIRIILSSTASDKAKYKQLLVDWLVALCILFFMHYIMSFAVTMVESVTQALKQSNQLIEMPFSAEDLQEKYESSVDDDTMTLLQNMENGNGKIQTDLMGLARFKAQLKLKSGEMQVVDESVAAVADGGREQMAYTIIYIVLVIYTIMFLFMYLKRLIYIIFLTMIAPLVALTYPIDKMNDGQAQAFNMWLKEYIFNLLIQPVHLILYSILLGSAMELATNYLIYPLVVLGFLLPAEKILRKFFGFEKSSTASSIAGGALGGAAVMNAINKIGSGAKKAIKGEKGSSGSNSENKNQNKIRMAERTADNPKGDDDYIRNALNGEEKPQLADTNEFDDNLYDNNPNNMPNYGETDAQLSSEEMAEQDPNYMYMNPGLFDESYQAQNTNENNYQDNEEYEEDDENIETLELEDNNSQDDDKAHFLSGVKSLAGRYVAPNIGKMTMGVTRLAAKGVVGGTLGTIGVAAGLASDDYKNVLTYGAGAATIGSGIGNSLAEKTIRMPSRVYMKGAEIADTYKQGAYSKDQYQKLVNRKLDREFLRDKENQELYKAKFGKEYKVAMEKAIEYRKEGVTDNNTIIKAMTVKSRNASKDLADKRRIVSAKFASQVSNEKDVETLQKRLKEKGIKEPQIKDQADMIRKIKGLY